MANLRAFYLLTYVLPMGHNPYPNSVKFLFLFSIYCKCVDIGINDETVLIFLKLFVTLYANEL